VAPTKLERARLPESRLCPRLRRGHRVGCRGKARAKTLSIYLCRGWGDIPSRGRSVRWRRGLGAPCASGHGAARRDIRCGLGRRNSGGHSKPNLHHESLADTIAQPTTPQEEPSGAEPPGAQGKRPIVLDLSQHYLLVFLQRAINKIFIRIDTSKANFEGEHMQQHQTIPPTNWIPSQPLPADHPRIGTTPGAPANLKYSTKSVEDSHHWKQSYTPAIYNSPSHTYGQGVSHRLGTTTTSTSRPPHGRVHIRRFSKSKNSTLTYDHIRWGNFTTGIDATPLPTSTHPPQKPVDDMLPIIRAPPPHPPAGPPKSGPTPDSPVNLKRPTLAYDHIHRAVDPHHWNEYYTSTH